MKINPFVYGILVLGVFLGTIGGFRVAGVWSVSGKVDASGQKITADGTDVESIKGWMTLGDIATAFNVPLDEILTHFDLPADTDPDTAVKDLESDTFDTTGLREWLAERQAGTSTQPEAAPVEAEPAPAPTATVQPASDAAAPEAVPTEHTAEDRTITGNVTFQQVLDWGVTQEAIEAILGGPMPPASLVIKDYVTGQGLEFSGVKTALQAEVDKTK